MAPDLSGLERPSLEKPGDAGLAARIEKTLVTVSLRACLAIALCVRLRLTPASETSLDARGLLWALLIRARGENDERRRDGVSL